MFVVLSLQDTPEGRSALEFDLNNDWALARSGHKNTPFYESRAPGLKGPRCSSKSCKVVPQKPSHGPHCARLRARSTAPKNDEVTKNGAFKPVEALRGGVRPSKDAESQLWDQVELSRDSGGQGPSWWALAANLRWGRVP